jgi:soluble P-type ATPase
MLREAALGIAILSPEGTSTAALLASDLVTADIFSALDLFKNPMRIVASLRA